ncbi:serine hydrolase [Secundilactobacillus folii]|nr:serine hydrolase [Secundilactobacillus folii]
MLKRRVKRLLMSVMTVLIFFVGVGSFGIGALAAPTSQQVKAQQQVVKKQLQSYLNKVSQDKTASVAFYNLGAQSDTVAGQTASAPFYKSGALAVYSPNAHKTYTSASTYKLFIIANICARIDAGTLNKKVLRSSGFEQMILHSRNEFAENYLKTYGAAKVNLFLRKLGLYSYVFASNRAARTTAASLSSIMRRLDQGKYPFDNASNRQRVLSLMQRQVYRSGIPKGAAQAMQGARAADKVGWLWSYNNDAAIVTLPNGQRYVLVVMTHGHGQHGFSGFPRIATITKNVQKIVYGGTTTSKIQLLYE